jgi:hypothetical protein
LKQNKHHLPRLVTINYNQWVAYSKLVDAEKVVWYFVRPAQENFVAGCARMKVKADFVEGI